MNAGREGETSEKYSPSKAVPVKVAATASKSHINTFKRTATQAHKVSATANSFKGKSTTATVSKITKLVLKPKPTTPKKSLTSKVTSKKYTTKPVTTIKSRSTVISRQSTFRVQNIKKSPPNKRQSTENAAFSVKSEQISHQMIVNTKSDTNGVVQSNKSFEMERSTNVTSLNVTKTVNSPVLQEITSAIVNGSNVVKSVANNSESNASENVKENRISPQKIVKHCENDVKCKSKSYDPIKARQFIQMQREKWKEAEKTEKIKSPATKDEIKNRLSALRKNTLKIVEKNVQKARTNIKPPINKKFTPKKPSEVKLTDKGDQLDKQTPQLQLSKVNSLVLTPSKFLPSIKSKKDRIGILRRTGISPTFESTTLVAQTPILASIKHTHNFDSGASPAQPIENRQSIFKNEQKQPNFSLQVPQTVPLKSSLFNEMTLHAEQHSHQNGQFSEQNMGMNEAWDRDRNDVCDEVGENEHNAPGGNVTTPKKEIPFWLRPTPVQPYPYNFIMAVRKKLESITHPVVQIKHQHQHQYEYQPQSQPVQMKQASPFQSPIARPDTRFISNYRRNFDRQPSESESENVKSSDVSPLKTSNDVEYSEGQEELEDEYSMNFSSVTKESMRDQSNILSKSKQKSVRASQDTLSISSGILSHSSPEKKAKTMASNGKNGTNVQNDDEIRQPSPLTTDNVDGLQITSQSLSHIERPSNASSVKSRQSLQTMPTTRHSTQSTQSSTRSTVQSTRDSSIVSHINFGRGKDYSGNSQLSLSKLSKQKNVEELLRDFTSSLSQVIEVNQRLHSILSNPPSSRESQYTDDFENATDNKQTEISERITGTHDNTSVPSYKTQNTSNAVESHEVETPNGDSRQMVKTDVNRSHTTTGDDVIEEFSGIISNEMSILSSTRNQMKSTFSIDLEESQGSNHRSVAEPSSHNEKESSTLVEEKINEYQSSESPTNNDLKSITLSIAKKSAATSDDTDQQSNAIETFNKQVKGEPDVSNESVGSDILNMFSKTSMNLGEDANNSVWSEHNISYSTLGMCDQLLKSETRKSEDLAALLKIREKSLIDRFKGQIAWLELKKQKYREKGLTAEISMIKKKQRALLLRLDNDRKELHRLLKTKQQSHSARNASNVNFNISHMTTNMSIRRTSVSKQMNNTTPKQALKAIELPGGGSALELMLQRRENELRRRREHVEKLLKWHQRLDVEEQEVIKMEQMIMSISTSDVYQTTSHEQINETVAITLHHHSKRTNCHNDDASVQERSLTNVSDTITMEKTRFEHKKQKQIHKIEKSLNTLKMISSRSISSDIDGSVVDDVVDIYGRQLNKLWKRLTGQYEEKYSPDKMYTLSKFDLEQMYEEAKLVVLQQFHKNEEFKRRLIDNSMSIIDGNQNNNISMPKLTEQINDNVNVEQHSESELEPLVPALNLASSPEPRENVVSDQGYYFTNSNIDLSNTQHQQPENEAIVEAPTSDATSQNFTSSQIQTEEPIEDEHSTSHQDDVQSDITEDSLNKPQSSNENVSPSEIKTQDNESGQSTQIPSIIETNRSSEPFPLNLTSENTQMIEETSFPNIDIETTVSSVAEDINVMSHDSLSPIKNPSDDQKYRSDDFEDGKSGDELTSISTVTQIATTTITNQSTDKSVDKSTEQSTLRNESPKELEQRLIAIDDGLRELSERISKSPVLQSESDSHHSNESNESEKSTGTKSPSSDNENKADQDDKSTQHSPSVETSEGDSDKITENETTESKSTNENEPSVGNEAPKVESDESTDSIAAEIAAAKADHSTTTESVPTKRPFQYTLGGGSIDYNKVPEADALKRSQVPSLETELKMAEQSSSSSIYPLLREIPNKPPPPYPVHRQLPKTPPFPSDDRIKEIVFNRIQELYEKSPSNSLSETPVRTDATFVKSPSLSITSPESPAAQDETNVFERIIFDCCEEIMQEISTPEKHVGCAAPQPLSFFNPPNRLMSYQKHALKRIYKLLNRPHLHDGIHVDEPKTFTGMRSFLPSQVAQLTYNNRRKRDAVDEILIQELYEDEVRWTNFDLEEKEIRESVPDLRTLLADDSSEMQETSVNASNTE